MVRKHSKSVLYACAKWITPTTCLLSLQSLDLPALYWKHNTLNLLINVSDDSLGFSLSYFFFHEISHFIYDTMKWLIRLLLHFRTYSIVGLDGYCCTWSHSITPTDSHTVGVPGRGIGPSQRPLPVQHTTFTRDKHPCPSAGFEPASPAVERPQTYALNRAVTEISFLLYFSPKVTSSNEIKTIAQALTYTPCLMY